MFWLVGPLLCLGLVFWHFACDEVSGGLLFGPVIGVGWFCGPIVMACGFMAFFFFLS